MNAQTVFLGLFAGSLLFGASGCGQASPGDGRGSASGSEALVLSPGVTVSTGTYAIVGPDDFTSAGTVAIGDSPDLSIVLGGLPLASGYEIDVSAIASDGVTLCDASAVFDVVGPTTTVQVHLVCGVPEGQILVTGTFNVCPVLDGVDALPNNALIGGKVSLTAFGHDADNGPSPLAYQWATNGVLLKNHPQPALNFFCTTPGVVAVRAGVSDGDPDPTCADSLTTNVSCVSP